MSLSPNAWRIHLSPAHGSAREIEVLDRPLLAGAAPDCDIPIDERFVSGEHFKVELTNQRLYVTDLGSRNGTYIGSLRLPPHTPTEWQPGTPLLIADAVRAELLPPLVPVAPNGAGYTGTGNVGGGGYDGRAGYIPPQRFTDPLPYVAPVAPVPMLDMALSAPVLRPGQLATVTVNYRSGGQGRVILGSAVQGAGIDCAIVPSEAYLAPGVPLTAQVTVRRLKPFYFGGRVPVQFSARTDEGSYARVAAEVRLRPRYEYLLLLLLPLLLCVASVAFALNPITIQPLPTETPTPTATPIPTSTDAIIDVPTVAPTATATITQTPVPSFTPLPQCVNRCAALGWSSYTIQPGDTLFGLGLAGSVSAGQVAQVNCIAESSTIYAGQQICLPVAPQISTPVPVLTCDGFRPTSPTAFAQGLTTFYWDAPRSFTPSAYRLSIYNADSGALVFQREQAPFVTNMQVDTAAISGTFRFFWTIDALVSGAVICTGRVDALRQAPDQPPVQPTQPPAFPTLPPSPPTFTPDPVTVIPDPPPVLSLDDVYTTAYLSYSNGNCPTFYINPGIGISNDGSIKATMLEVMVEVTVHYFHLLRAHRMPVSDIQIYPIVFLDVGDYDFIDVAEFEFPHDMPDLVIGVLNETTEYQVDVTVNSGVSEGHLARLSFNGRATYYGCENID
ncbi:MAG: FHA domain-containing protein [Chloroflexota bacterium]|nr:FHA domain-containing protein [Chloroflexota bacterium]